MEPQLLTFEELFKIGFGGDTIRKYHVSNDGKTHILRMTAEMDGAPMGDISIWLIYSATAEPILGVLDTITSYCDGMAGRLVVLETDCNEMPVEFEVLCLSDQKISWTGVEYTKKDGEIEGFIGCLVGNGYTIDTDKTGVALILAYILANQLGPIDPFLAYNEKGFGDLVAKLADQGITFHHEEEEA